MGRLNHKLSLAFALKRASMGGDGPHQTTADPSSIDPCDREQGSSSSSSRFPCSRILLSRLSIPVSPADIIHSPAPAPFPLPSLPCSKYIMNPQPSSPSPDSPSLPPPLDPPPSPFLSSLLPSPHSDSSLRSFLLSMAPPPGKHSSPSSSLSSLSTLAFISSSASIKSRHVLINLGDQSRDSEQLPVISALATALRSLMPLEKPYLELISRFKATPEPKVKKKRPILTETAPSNQSVAQNETVLLRADESGTCGGCEPRVKKMGKNNGQSSAEKIESISKYLVAGAVSTIVSRTSVAPLERLKLEYIVGRAKHNWIHVIQGIWVSEGLRGFWKGNTLNLLRLVPFKSINFLAYEMFCKEILEKQGKTEVTKVDRLVAGAFSGAAATLICFPLDTARTRLIAPGGEALGGMLGCFHQMIHREGFCSLYKGLLPALLSMVPSAAVFYGVYDILKSGYLKSSMREKQLQLHNTEKKRNLASNVDGDVPSSGDDSIVSQLELGPVRTLIYGAIAGACAEIVTYPLEVVRRQLQLQQTTAKGGLITVFQTIVEQDGLNALFSGVLPSSVQVLPSAALSYLVYESVKTILKST